MVTLTKNRYLYLLVKSQRKSRLSFFENELKQCGVIFRIATVIFCYCLLYIDNNLLITEILIKVKLNIRFKISIYTVVLVSRYSVYRLNK